MTEKERNQAKYLNNNKMVGLKPLSKNYSCLNLFIYRIKKLFYKSVIQVIQTRHHMLYKHGVD